MVGLCSLVAAHIPLEPRSLAVVGERLLADRPAAVGRQMGLAVQGKLDQAEPHRAGPHRDRLAGGTEDIAGKHFGLRNQAQWL